MLNIVNIKSDRFDPTHLDGNGCKRIKTYQLAKNIFKPEVSYMVCGGQHVVVKDYRNYHPIFRDTICRYLLHREIRALELLDGTEGVPKLIGRYDNYGLKIQHIAGKAPSKQTFVNHPHLAEQLLMIIERFREIGVTHNDIRYSNMVVNPAGDLFMIDFGAAVTKPVTSGPISWIKLQLFKQLLVTDYAKVLKVLEKTQKRTLTDCEKRILQKSHTLHRATNIWRLLRKMVRNKEK